MGPRQCAGENLTSSDSRSFASELQWGPGSVPGRTPTLTHAGAEPKCFNGAPAVCRGEPFVRPHCTTI